MPALPQEVNLAAYRGDTWAQTFVLKDGSGQPIDLSDATVESWARSSRGELVTMRVTVNGTPGQVTLAQPEGGLDGGYWRYDLEVTSVDGNVTTWLRGTLAVEVDVTNAPEVP